MVENPTEPTNVPSMKLTTLIAVLCLCSSGHHQVRAQSHHQGHFERYGQAASGYNRLVLRAIDRVQASAPDGGGYFIGLKADPPESPIGYPLRLFGRQLLQPPRSTSYCSGSSYAVFIETLNAVYPYGIYLSPERVEALRMQEPDGSRREDGVKAWGWWNADGFGSHYAMAQYLQVGEAIGPAEAQPGDFLNISWKSGLGHSVVFLGYSHDDQGQLQVTFFSSQPGTNGLADLTVAADKIREVKFVRLTHPEQILSFPLDNPVRTAVEGDDLGDIP